MDGLYGPTGSPIQTSQHSNLNDTTIKSTKTLKNAGPNVDEKLDDVGVEILMHNHDIESKGEPLQNHTMRPIKGADAALEASQGDSISQKEMTPAEKRAAFLAKLAELDDEEDELDDEEDELDDANINLSSTIDTEGKLAHESEVQEAELQQQEAELQQQETVLEGQEAQVTLEEAQFLAKMGSAENIDKGYVFDADANKFVNVGQLVSQGEDGVKKCKALMKQSNPIFFDEKSETLFVPDSEKHKFKAGQPLTLPDKNGIERQVIPKTIRGLGKKVYEAIKAFFNDGIQQFANQAAKEKEREKAEQKAIAPKAINEQIKPDGNKAAAQKTTPQPQVAAPRPNVPDVHTSTLAQKEKLLQEFEKKLDEAFDNIENFNEKLALHADNVKSDREHATISHEELDHQRMTDGELKEGLQNQINLMKELPKTLKGFVDGHPTNAATFVKERFHALRIEKVLELQKKFNDMGDLNEPLLKTYYDQFKIMSTEISQMVNFSAKDADTPGE